VQPAYIDGDRAEAGLAKGPPSTAPSNGHAPTTDGCIHKWCAVVPVCVVVVGGWGGGG
jgi:hypothetical protein